jgi:hypothetical protein
MSRNEFMAEVDRLLYVAKREGAQRDFFGLYRLIIATSAVIGTIVAGKECHRYCHPFPY